MDYGKIAYLKAVDLEKQLLSLKSNINNMSNKISVQNTIFEIKDVNLSVRGTDMLVDTFEFCSDGNEGLLIEYYIFNNSSATRGQATFKIYVDDALVETKLIDAQFVQGDSCIRTFVDKLNKGNNICTLKVDTDFTLYVQRIELVMNGNKIYKKE